MDNSSTHELLFRCLLGRSLSASERAGVSERYGTEQINPELIANEIINSDEYHTRHRQSFVEKQFPTPTVVLARGPFGHQIYCDLRQLHLGLSMACGHYEPDETAFIASNIKRGMTVLDVGANVGYFTTMFAALVGEPGKVIALEPVADTFQKLASAITINRFNAIVELHNIAASESDGTCQLSYDVASSNMGGVSIRPMGAELAHSIVQTAGTKRIDDIVWGRKVDFIKIDIEGAEALALRGATQTITQSRPTILMEFNSAQLAAVSQISSSELFDHVIGFGYRARTLQSGGSTSTVSSEDVQRLTGQGHIVNLVFIPE